MRFEPGEHQDQSADYADERGVGARAGIFLLHGRFHVANHRSRAERILLDGGALLVASLVFDESEAQRIVAGGSPRPVSPRAPEVRPLTSREAARLGRPPIRN